MPVDVLTRTGVQGDVANHMSSHSPLAMRPFIANDGRAYTYICNGDPKNPKSYKKIQVNAGTLRRDEWKRLDEAVINVAESRLGGAQDLISRGLTYPLGNAMGTTVLEWHDVSDMGEADMTMDGVSRSQGDRPVFQHNYLPIPIIHFDYEINTRVLEASRKLGNPLDTTSAERAARKCMEKLEQLFFTNTTYSFGEKDSRSRNSIYSYINHPDRNTVTLGTGWDSLTEDSTGTVGEQIKDQVLEMKQTSINNYHYGPWVIYIPTAYETVMDNDYDTSGQSTQTIRERILKINGITDIKVVDTLPADNVVMVQTTSDVVRLVQGMGVTNVQWQTEGNFVNKFKVMTIQVPQIRSDQNGKSGIVHLA